MLREAPKGKKNSFPLLSVSRDLSAGDAGGRAGQSSIRGESRGETLLP